jgi:predicted nucleotidyltransferase
MGKNSLFGFVAIGLFGFRGINLSQSDFDLLVAVLQQREGVAVITAK